MAGTSGSHAGSFAGGFIKAFMAMMQMGLRARHQEKMDKFYDVMMQQMQQKMLHDQRIDDAAGLGRATAKSNLENFSLGGQETEGKLKVSEMTDMAKKAGFQGADAAHMGAIAAAESNGNQDAVGKADEVGITQINPHTWPELANLAKQGPQQAMNAAFQVYTKAGNSFSPWSTDPSSANFTPKNSMEKFLGTARKAAGIDGQRVSAIDTRDSGEAKSFLSSVSNHADRAGDTSNMNSEFATRLADAIKQANAEGIPARLESGYRDPDELWNRGDRSKAAYFDAEGLSKHSDGRAGDIAGIGTAGSDTAQRWAEIANSKGLSVPYGYDNPKEFNHTELAGLTPLRGAQPVNAASNMVAGPGARGGLAPLPESSIKRVPTTTPYIPPANAPDQGTPNLGGGITQPQLPPSSVPAAPVAPTTTAPAAAAPVAQPAAIPTRAQQPDYRYGMPAGGRGGGQYQYVVPAGPQPQLAQPAQPIPQQAQPQQTPQQTPQPVAAIPDRTDALASAPMPPPDPRQGQRPQQVPVDQQPMPPPRPADLTGETDTSGSFSPANLPSLDAQNVSNTGGGAGGSSADPLWAGYVGASPDEAASADPLSNMYSSSQDFSASAGLTDTSGMMAAGAMADMASAEEPDMTAEMYRGGPVIRYQRGGVIKRYADGGDTDEDMLSEYGGTDTDDPGANVYWDQQRVNQQLTNNSDSADLTTSIQNRAMAGTQDQPPIQIPPAEPLTNPLLTQAPTDQPAAPTDGQPAEPPATPTDGQPAAPTDDRDQERSQSDIPPGSVQVAGPGGFGSVGKGELTHIPMPRVGGYGGGGMGGIRRPSMSTLMGGGRRVTGVGKGGQQELYTPGYVGDNDYNHLGLAPTYNADGSPGVWLMNMVGNGVRALFQGFGFANQGAMPGSQQQTQNLQIFGSNDNPGIPTKQDMTGLRNLVDPHHDFIEGAAEIGGAVSMIKYYSLTGNLEAASRLAGGVLLYTRMQYMQYGDEAVKSLFKGDYKEAVRYLEKAHGWVPDGKTSSADVIDEKTGKVRAYLKDGNGNILDQKDYGPAAVMEAALGAKNGTSYWGLLSNLAAAGNNDPIGSHYQTQQMLRGIKGNENVPPDPFAKPPPGITIDSGPAPDGSQPPAAPDGGPTPVVTPPDGSQAPAPDGSSVQTAPPAAPPAAPAAPAMPSQDGMRTGMAVPAQPPTAPATAMASRGDISNLVAGPGARGPTDQPQSADGGSGGYLVSREQQAPERAQQSAAISRMVQGGAFDPDDPYIHQKIAGIDAQLKPLEDYRSKLEGQMADIEASNMNPQDKRAMQVALAAKIKGFNDTTWKNAVQNRNTIINQMGARLKEQFRVQLSAAQQAARVQENMRKERLDQEKANANTQIGILKQVGPNDEQMRNLYGQKSDGSYQTDKDGNRIFGFDGELNAGYGTMTTDGKQLLNPLERYGQAQPFLSQSFVPNPNAPDKGASSFDPHTIKDRDGNELYSAPRRKTMFGSAEDIVKFNRGMSATDAKDFVVGLGTGNYTIVQTPTPHQMPPSPMLQNKDAPDIVDENQRLRAPDGEQRYDVIISRGGNDPGTRVIMSRNEAAKLVAINQDALKTIRYNKDIYDAKQIPNDQVIPDRPGPVIAPAPPEARPSSVPPSSASKAPVATPPSGPPINPTQDLFPKFAPGQGPIDWFRNPTGADASAPTESASVPAAIGRLYDRAGGWYNRNVPGANAPPLRPMHPPLPSRPQ